MAVSGLTAQSTYLETAMNRSTTIILASALAVSAQIAPAADQTDAPVRRVNVHFSDLNLTGIEGATTLYHRLQSAAQSVCAEDGTKDLGSLMRVKTCVAAAISAAVTQVNQPTLTAYYRSKLGTANAAVRQASR
jgi:UrcA family protein